MNLENVSEFKSSLGIKYPSQRDDVVLTVQKWLFDKRTNDGAEDLWRVHDGLFDFSKWSDVHPGGSDWLILTKGTDITEAFESHHISKLPETMLEKFYVREATTPRNYPFTYSDGGFYRTLKERLRPVIENLPKEPKQKTKNTIDLLLLVYISTSISSVFFYSFALGAIGGVMLAMLAIAAHNFFHQKDNFRMYYFDLSLMSSREWRISHILSHHLYTNTVIDMELSILEPFLLYLPKEKHIFRRLLSLGVSPFVYTFMFPIEFFRRFITSITSKDTESCKSLILPVFVLTGMYLLGGQSFMSTLLIWMWIILCGSFYFGLIGLNAAHHHPNIFHDGDTARKNLDWGLYQMDAVMDRKEINNSQFLVLTTFGHHALHHLFPTIDHGHLEYFYPVFKQTCQEFGIKFRVVSQLQLVGGQFLQLLRVRPNPNSPGTEGRKGRVRTLFDYLKPYRNVA